MTNQNKECKPKKKPKVAEPLKGENLSHFQGYNQAWEEMDEYYQTLLKPFLDKYNDINYTWISEDVDELMEIIEETLEG